MSAETPDQPDSRRYQVVVGLSAAALETMLNQVAAQDPGLEIRALTYAHGTGFVAVLARPHAPVKPPPPARKRAG